MLLSCFHFTAVTMILLSDGMLSVGWQAAWCEAVTLPLVETSHAAMSCWRAVPFFYKCCHAAMPCWCNVMLPLVLQCHAGVVTL